MGVMRDLSVEYIRNSLGGQLDKLCFSVRPPSRNELYTDCKLYHVLLLGNKTLELELELETLPEITLRLRLLSGIVRPSFMFRTPKLTSCHNAKFVVTGGTGGCNDAPMSPMMTKSASWQLSVSQGLTLPLPQKGGCRRLSCGYSAHFNSLRPNDAYMRHHRFRPSLRPSNAYAMYASISYPSSVQIMACRLAGAKPLSEPLLKYC